MSRVYVTSPLPEPGIELLNEAGLEVDQHGTQDPPTRDELRRQLATADGVLCLLTDRLDRDLLASAPRLRVVANLAVGYDNVDLDAARERGIVVTNTPDVLTEATADLTWALLLATARRLVEADRLVRGGTWPGWRPSQLLGTDIHGATLGIVGLGKIGRAVARRARGFDMTILYSNRRPDPSAAEEVGATYAPLEDLLARADVVSLHAPLTDASRHLIDASALDLMKPSAILVNTARGGLVDEAALTEVLRRRGIAAAGLDVFVNEPALSPGLVELDNVVVLPHIGSATRRARAAMVRLCCENIIAVLADGRPLTPVT